MSHISLRAIGKTAAAICLAVAMSGVAMAGDAPDRVVMQSPAKDAAVLAKMQGLVNNRKAKTLSGLSRTINDGVVIRKSTIKDGKIIIPPSGLYITVRSTNWHPFDNEPLTLSGKRVILRWNGKHNGDLLLDYLHSLLSRAFPDTEFIKAYETDPVSYTHLTLPTKLEV